MLSLLRQTLICALTALAVGAGALGGCTPAGAAEGASGGKKVLVAYFSHTGNTRAIASHIAGRTGGELFEIKAVNAYPASYNECIDRAKKEQEGNARPALSSKLGNAGGYDVIFLGFPNWWGTIPMPLFTFMEANDFSGKMILPFCTHEGSGLGRSAADIAKLSPKATVAQGLAVRGSGAATAQADIDAWLQKNGFGR